MMTYYPFKKEGVRDLLFQIDRKRVKSWEDILIRLLHGNITLTKDVREDNQRLHKGAVKIYYE